MINKRFLLAVLLTLILYPAYLLIQTVRDIDHRLKTNYYREQLNRTEEKIFSVIAWHCLRELSAPPRPPAGWQQRRVLKSTKASPFGGRVGAIQPTSLYHTLTQTLTSWLANLFLLIFGPHLNIVAC